MSNELSPETIVSRFHALLSSFDYVEELSILGIGKYSFRKKKKLIIEIQSLYIALWKIALEKSFPESWNTYFNLFLEELGVRLKYSAQTAQFSIRRIDVYDTLLAPTKENNFSEVARQLVSTYIKKREDLESPTLKFSLKIRQVYTLIFDRLI